MTALDRLRMIAVALYGERWQHAVARDLGCHHRQITRWTRHEYEPTQQHIDQLADVAEQRAKALLATAKRMRRSQTATAY